MASSKIKKNDQVQIITGKDKGRSGKVLAVDTKNHKVLVEGINMVKKHAKPSAAHQQGGIIDQEAWIDVSNVMYLHNGEPTRIGFKTEGEQKVRYAKATGESIE